MASDFDFSIVHPPEQLLVTSTASLRQGDRQQGECQRATKVRVGHGSKLFTRLPLLVYLQRLQERNQILLLVLRQSNLSDDVEELDRVIESQESSIM